VEAATSALHAVWHCQPQGKPGSRYRYHAPDRRPDQIQEDQWPSGAQH
jgi:hypothetical protein